MKTVVAKFPQMVSLKNVLVVMGIWNPVLKKVLQYIQQFIFSVRMKIL